MDLFKILINLKILLIFDVYLGMKLQIFGFLFILEF